MSSENKPEPENEKESNYSYEIERYEGLVFEFTVLLLQGLDPEHLLRMEGYKRAGLTEGIPAFADVIQQAAELANVYVSEENWRQLQRLAQNN